MRRCLLLTVATLARCHGGGSPEQRDAPPPRVESPRADEIVVARVDGVPILASDVARQARLAGVSTRAALDSLIDMEVLVAEATRRGLAATDDAIDTARRAAVGRLLEEEFERAFLAGTVSESDLLARYRQQQRRFVQPELRRVVHALAAVSGSSPGSQRTEAEARARALASAAAAGPLDPLAFGRLAQAHSDAGIQFRVEGLGTARTGDTAEPFAKAAFELERPGLTSGVVATSFGYHVILLVGIEPAAVRSFDDARAQILDEARHELRERAFERFMRHLESGHQIVIEPAPISSPREG